MKNILIVLATLLLFAACDNDTIHPAPEPVAKDIYLVVEDSSGNLSAPLRIAVGADGRQIPDFINEVNRRMVTETATLIRWQHLYFYRAFIKFEDYKPEQEIRLLCTDEKRFCEKVFFSFEELSLKLKDVHHGPLYTGPKNLLP